MAKKIPSIPLPLPAPDQVLDFEFQLEAAFNELAERAPAIAGLATRSRRLCPG
jgi:hypothetical protein